jgi:hypothetical protein
MRLRSALVIFLPVISSVGAATVTYQYTGTPITNVVSGLMPTNSYINAYFVMPEFAPSGTFNPGDMIDYGIVVGGLTLTKAGGADFGATLIFGQDHNLMSWSFVLGNYRAGGGLVTPTSYSAPSLLEGWLNSNDLPPTGDRLTVFFKGPNDPYPNTIGVTAANGTWTFSTVPESSSSIFAAAGFVTMLMRRRRVSK